MVCLLRSVSFSRTSREICSSCSRRACFAVPELCPYNRSTEAAYGAKSFTLGIRPALKSLVAHSAAERETCRKTINITSSLNCVFESRSFNISSTSAISWGKLLAEPKRSLANSFHCLPTVIRVPNVYGRPARFAPAKTGQCSRACRPNRIVELHPSRGFCVFQIVYSALYAICIKPC